MSTTQPSGMGSRSIMATMLGVAAGILLVVQSLGAQAWGEGQPTRLGEPGSMGCVYFAAAGKVKASTGHVPRALPVAAQRLGDQPMDQRHIEGLQGSTVVYPTTTPGVYVPVHVGRMTYAGGQPLSQRHLSGVAQHVVSQDGLPQGQRTHYTLAQLSPGSGVAHQQAVSRPYYYDDGRGGLRVGGFYVYDSQSAAWDPRQRAYVARETPVPASQVILTLPVRVGHPIRKR